MSKKTIENLKKIKGVFTSQLSDETYSQSETDDIAGTRFITDVAYGMMLKQACDQANIGWQYSIKSMFGNVAKASAKYDEFACSTSIAKAIEQRIIDATENINAGESFYDTL